MYKHVLNSVVKISMMFAKYFEYYTVILRGPLFRGHAVYTGVTHGVGRTVRLRQTRLVAWCKTQVQTDPSYITRYFSCKQTHVLIG